MRDQRFDVEAVEIGALMAAGEDASAHRAAVVIELHFEKGGAHARRLPAALLRACGEAGRSKRQPAEQAQARTAPSGSAMPDFAAQAEENGKPERQQATAEPSSRARRSSGSTLEMTLSAHKRERPGQQRQK